MWSSWDLEGLMCMTLSGILTTREDDIFRIKDSEASEWKSASDNVIWIKNPTKVVQIESVKLFPRTIHTPRKSITPPFYDMTPAGFISSSTNLWYYDSWIQTCIYILSQSHVRLFKNLWLTNAQNFCMCMPTILISQGPC